MWTLDQLQGVLAVNVPVRATIIKLSAAAGGGLLVHNPVAPTNECVDLVRQLEAQHGPVRHIVLGTLGLEHKAFVGPFSKQFNQATVWVQPGQWSWPLPLPLPLLGFPSGGRLKELPPTGSDATASSEELPEWFCDLEYRVLGPLCISTLVGGYFGESAFYHRPTSTLLVTDAVVQVEDAPPPVLQEDPTCLLYHARDEIGERVDDTAEVRKRGWRRIVQFGLFFFPSAIDVKLSTIPSDLKRQPSSMRQLAQTEGALPFGVLPWAWARDDVPSFKALQGGLLCAPILQAIILNRFPDETKAWVDEVCKWRFRRIVPCHLANDVKAGPDQFRKAFAFLDEDAPASKRGQPQALEGDFALLAKASGVLTRLGVIGPPTAGQLVERKS